MERQLRAQYTSFRLAWDGTKRDIQFLSWLAPSKSAEWLMQAFEGLSVEFLVEAG